MPSTTLSILTHNARDTSQVPYRSIAVSEGSENSECSDLRVVRQPLVLSLEHLSEDAQRQGADGPVLHDLHGLQQLEDGRLEVLLPVALLRVASGQSVDGLQCSLLQLGAGGVQDDVSILHVHVHVVWQLTTRAADY